MLAIIEIGGNTYLLLFDYNPSNLHVIYHDLLVAGFYFASQTPREGGETAKVSV